MFQTAKMMEADGMGRWQNAMFCPKEDIELTCNMNIKWARLFRLKTSFFRAVLVKYALFCLFLRCLQGRMEGSCGVYQTWCKDLSLTRPFCKINMTIMQIHMNIMQIR
jgi:hypothetical protein